MCILYVLFFINAFDVSVAAFLRDYKYLDICSLQSPKKIYVEYGTSGDLLADYKNQLAIGPDLEHGENTLQKKCRAELITCPSCVIDIKFKFLNISRNCGKSGIPINCGCDYVLLHEPPFGNISGEQYCGKFVQNNVSELAYYSRTRLTTIDFYYTGDYGHAFTLKFSARRNQKFFEGYPTESRMNDNNQILTSSFFPHLYPADLTTEYVIRCHSQEPCRISLLFTDFLLADSSILEFFDSNGQRMYVISGNIFRPPVIVTSGPSLILRFYANGASDSGFKATYSFILGNYDDVSLKPNIADCGGQVNNLGGGITMMNMVPEGTKFFDCIWILKTPANFLHRKTHLYVKVVNFTNFAGTTELVLRQGVTSNESPVEILKYPSHFKNSKEKEHIVSIKEGFYISLRGLFRPESQVAIVYAAFNNKDCFTGLDFLCNNLRCISALLNCDGFDHCGDNSDESPECSQDPKDHGRYSKVPNFLFPKVEPYADLSAATFVFLLCTFGLIGIIFAMALLLYRVNTRARHQRQIQDHIETIHAILEEGVADNEEEMIIPDEPPDYEPPPEYSDVLKYIRRMACGNRQKHQSCSSSSKTSPSNASLKSAISDRNEAICRSLSTSDSYQMPSECVPESPPPAYDNVQGGVEVNFNFTTSNCLNAENVAGNSRAYCLCDQDGKKLEIASCSDEKLVTCFPKKVFTDIRTTLKENIKKCKSSIYTKHSMKRVSFSNENLVRYFSDSELILKYRISNGHTSTTRNLTKRSFSTNDLGN